MRFIRREWMIDLAEIAILVAALMLLATGLGRAADREPFSLPTGAAEAQDVR